MTVRLSRPAAVFAIVAVLTVATGYAADRPSIQRQIEDLQRALAAQKSQLDAQQKLLEQQAALIEQLREQAPPIAETASAKPKDPPGARVSMNQGRPTIASADGRASFSLRALAQLDMADHHDGSEGAAATDFRRGSVGGAGNRETNAAKDLSDGAYFRRARLGFDGRVARDFDYRLMLELGGAGMEGPTRVNDAWIAYTGFAPVRLQLGAFAPPANMADSTSPEDLLFLERATPSEISRALAGADGRTALSIRGSGTRWMSALTFAGRAVGDAEIFDSQFAVLARVGFLAATSSSYNVHVGVAGTKVFQPADQGSAVAGARFPIRFRDRLEIRIDSTRLIDTGPIDADSAYAASVEFGMNWKNGFVQAENFWYGIERRKPASLPDPAFGGYYIETSWVLTGESHRYNAANGSFQSPRPRLPFSAAGGIGAWELALRYSHADLDFREGLAGSPATMESVRGGTQNIWTLGVNWYLNTHVRLMLDYLHIDVDRLNPAGPGNLQPFGPAPATPPIGVQVGQDLNVIALRSQYSF
jgi:phosphate-selective porin OprO/OprP